MPVATATKESPNLSFRLTFRDVKPEDAIFELYKQLYAFSNPEQATALVDGMAGIEERVADWLAKHG